MKCVIPFGYRITRLGISSLLIRRKTAEGSQLKKGGNVTLTEHIIIIIYCMCMYMHVVIAVRMRKGVPE